MVTGVIKPFSLTLNSPPPQSSYLLTSAPADLEKGRVLFGSVLFVFRSSCLPLHSEYSLSQISGSNSTEGKDGNGLRWLWTGDPLTSTWDYLTRWFTTTGDDDVFNRPFGSNRLWLLVHFAKYWPGQHIADLSYLGRTTGCFNCKCIKLTSFSRNILLLI